MQFQKKRSTVLKVFLKNRTDMMPTKKYKIAIIAPEPLYYHVPLFRKLAKAPEIDLMVYYCSDESLSGIDIEKMYCTKGKIVDKDSLLDGYNCKFLKNYSFSPSILNWPFGLINLGIWKEITDNNFDAVIIQSWTNLTWWLAFFACLIFKTPVLFMTDANVVSEHSKSRTKIFIKKTILGNFLFKKASGFLTSGISNEEFYKYYGVLESKITRLPFSWGYEKFLEEASILKLKREETRKKFNIKEGDFIILYVGRLSEEKNPMIILDAYKNIKNLNKKLFVVGDGPMRKEFEEKINELKIKNVNMIGFLPHENIFTFYNIADVLVLPSKAETWGIVVNEAMCFSLPIIASDKVGAVKDLVKDKYNGFIFPSGSVDKLTICFEDLMSLPKEGLVFFRKRSKEIIEKWVKKIDPVYQIIKAIEITNKK